MLFSYFYKKENIEKIKTFTELLKNISILFSLIIAGVWALSKHINLDEIKLASLERISREIKLQPALNFKFEINQIPYKNTKSKAIFIKLDIHNTGGGNANLVFIKMPITIGIVNYDKNGLPNIDYLFELDAYKFDKEIKLDRRISQKVVKVNENDSLTFTAKLEPGYYYIEFNSNKGKYNHEKNIASPTPNNLKNENSAYIKNITTISYGEYFKIE